MLNSIQVLRALAAWLVVFHHFMQLFAFFNSTDSVSNSAFRTILTHGSIGVDLFFVISGFVIFYAIERKQVSPFIFIRNGLVRIVPAYWFFTALTALVLVYFPGVVPLTAYAPDFMLKSLLFIPTLNPSGIGFFPLLTVGWTLNYEIVFYMAGFLSLFFSRNASIFVLMFALVSLQLLSGELGGGFVFYANSILYEFLFGVLVSIAYRRGWLRWISPPLASLMIFFSIVIIGSSVDVVHDPFRFGLPCAIVLMAVLSLEQYFPNNGLFKRLGDWSYSTYLCHVLVISFVLRWSQLFKIGLLPSFIVIVALVVLISFVSYELLERSVLRLVKRYG